MAVFPYCDRTSTASSLESSRFPMKFLRAISKRSVKSRCGRRVIPLQDILELAMEHLSPEQAAEAMTICITDGVANDDGHDLYYPEDNLVIEKVLTVSTAHITEGDMRLLTQMADDPLGFTGVFRAHGEHGVFLNTSVLTPGDVGLSPSVQALVSFCKERGIEWMLLDQDAETYSQFEKFD